MKDLQEANIEALASEFIGTFFLVLTVGLNALQNTVLAPLSIGLMLAVMISATGNVSGGHFNPAVTLAVQFSERAFRGEVACFYVLAQLGGALTAGFICRDLLGASFTFRPGHGHGLADVAAVEAIFSVALVLVVLCVSRTDDQKQPSCQYAPFAVGFLVAAAGFSIGDVSGCSLNPAVAFGMMSINWFHTGAFVCGHFGLYLLCPVAGALIGAGLFNFVNENLLSSTSKDDDDSLSERRPLLGDKPRTPPRQAAGTGVSNDPGSGRRPGRDRLRLGRAVSGLAVA
eukprot:TRINITY_DN25592_c0_g1_i1.p1 TRINITY_DN25592_c0_g1~~TRINITY_DN25592_c0_g1_i1.p1  ORF type:complete len:311 (+),score=38.33 TRINITY_DN25592_c0_g1_i1:78-935(+)